MRKIIENLLYQVIFQIAKIVFSLISVPIVSRTLGPSCVGLRCILTPLLSISLF